MKDVISLVATSFAGVWLPGLCFPLFFDVLITALIPIPLLVNGPVPFVQNSMEFKGLRNIPACIVMYSSGL